MSVPANLAVPSTIQSSIYISGETRIEISYANVILALTGTSTEQLYDIELLVKNLFDPVIKAQIILSNRSLIKANTPLRIVIGGGEAFNFYFKPHRVIETHDYDLRIISIDPNFYNDPDSLQKMQNAKQSFMKDLEQDLNRQPLVLYNKTSGLQWMTNFKSEIVGQLLSACKYKIGNSEDAIVDIITYHPSLLPEQFHTEGDRTDGFIREIIEPIHDRMNSELMYIRLGFLVWDTIRMLDWTRQRLGTGGGAKFNRYKDKYRYIIATLNNPQQWLKCGPLGPYIDSCLQQIKQYKPYDTPNYPTVNEIIKEGILNGLFPSILGTANFSNLLSKEYAYEQGLIINKIKQKLQ